MKVTSSADIVLHDNVGGVGIPTVLTVTSGDFKTGGHNITVGALYIEGGTFNSESEGGTWDVNGKIDIAENASFNASSGIVRLQGDWSNSGTFNSNTGEVILDGNQLQDILSGGDSFYDLTLNNNAGAVISDNTIVSNSITLTAGLLTIGTNNLIVNSGGLIKGTGGGTNRTDFSKTNMIVTNSTGKLKRETQLPGKLLFPVGTNNSSAEYSPVTVDFISGNFEADAGMEIRAVPEKAPATPSRNTYLNRYWVAESENINDFKADTTCYYLEKDVAGTESEIVLGRYLNGSWTAYNIADTEVHSISGKNLNSFCVLSGILNPEVPDIDNGMNINDGTDTKTHTSWRTSIDDGPETSEDSDEGSGLYEFNPISFFDGSVNAVSDGVYLMDIQSEYLDIGDGEYGLDGPLSGGFPNGEHSVEFGTEFIGGPSYIEQEFNREYDGIINLSMDFDYDSFDFEAIAAYNREKPAAFMTELDEVLEMV